VNPAPGDACDPLQRIVLVQRDRQGEVGPASGRLPERRLQVQGVQLVLGDSRPHLDDALVAKALDKLGSPRRVNTLMDLDPLDVADLKERIDIVGQGTVLANGD
jgi:hypothetical protein